MFFLAVLLAAIGFMIWRLRAKGAPVAVEGGDEIRGRRGGTLDVPGTLREGASQALKFVMVAAFALSALLAAASTVRVVDPGYGGVMVLFGRVRPEPLPSGLHMINPFCNLVQMEVRTRNYTMSSQHDEGQRRGDDSISVITSDGLTVNLDVTVLYAMDLARLPDIYRTLGENVEERLIRSEIRSAIRDAAASLAATDLYSAKRQEFVAWVTKTLTERFTSRGISLEQVLLRDVRLPQQITQAINAKIAADQEAQKMTFVLQKEKQEAERKRIEAEGQAKAQEIVSKSLTPQILDYQRIQALKDIGAHGNLVITGSGGGTPLINVSPKRGE